MREISRSRVQEVNLYTVKYTAEVKFYFWVELMEKHL